jgi:MYXO-CTERM domain-containing protein
MSRQRFLRSFASRVFAIAVVLLVASCSGGGCSSGCAGCGTTPLPNGFPPPETIENVAAIRITRPGLTFVQESLPTITERALEQDAGTASDGVVSVPIPPSESSGVTICSETNPAPPKCLAEIAIGTAKQRINAATPSLVKLDGTVPIRVRDLPIRIWGIGGYVAVGDAAQAPGGDLCAVTRGSASFPYKEVPINVELPLVNETRAPRTGYTKVDVAGATIDVGIVENDVEICISGCTGLCAGALDVAKAFAFNTLMSNVDQQIKDGLSSAFCTKPTPGVTPPCPIGSAPDDPDPAKAKQCDWTGGGGCVPSLLGLDGHMVLAQALASVSPGTQGGLDFVLASGGNMIPAPSTAGVPSWTPRNPAVPAEDNNDNGISLVMRGGLLPQPKTDCVEIVRRAPPQGIVVPPELSQNSLAPWTGSGPHLGVGIAGRFLDHALLGAYNSGALCLGVSTEQVDQLNSGYLSLLLPSVKTLTFEQAPSAAALTTRPGAPPKIAIGGGTDLASDPLLLLTLERLAVDFYVFSHDRFIRMFTYTADIAIPLNLQTGKDPERNPNGGLLPVVGDLRITKASVENDTFLFEDAKTISDGVTGLLAGVVSQALGSGIAPIDLSTALGTVGLGLEIPEGGIRKLVSSSDEFLAVFGNLTKAVPAAREEAETRARLLERIVDPSAMSLTTAARARFPKLRVAVDSVASRPTEHTWWIDGRTHAPWTTAREILVDEDAMLLQGRHVLHVSARIVGDVISEDSTPLAIPFVIDTLPPSVTAERDGERVTVRAWDYVSAREALRVRHRTPGGPFTDWEPLETGYRFGAPSDVEVEVRDEEGNIGRVRLGLRGRVDPSLAAGGSGCSCRTAPQTEGAEGQGRALAAAFGLAFLVRRRARRQNARSTASPRDKRG